MSLDGYDLYTVTGPRCAGRTQLSELVQKKHESLLQDVLPGWTFEFLGNPLGHLPLPPVIEPQECMQFARARLLEHWSEIYKNIIKYYLPIIERRKRGEKIIAFTDGLGLDALTDATAYTKDAEGRRKATLLHHTMVHHLLVSEHIKPPLYFLLVADCERVDDWMLQKNPELAETPRMARLDFIRHQERTCQEYFRPGNNQAAFTLNAERYSLPELASQVFEHVCTAERTRTRKVA